VVAVVISLSSVVSVIDGVLLPGSLPDVINCSTKESSTLEWKGLGRCELDDDIASTYEMMMAASMVSRKTTKKMVTENRFLPIVKGCQESCVYVERFLEGV
jgi:hypothetical protein